MIKCHFIDVFKTFRPDELNNFRNFIDSPYFNKRKKLVELYDVIKDYYPFFTDENFSRECIFEKIYPDEEYSYGKINEGLSALYKISLNYIKQVSFENNETFGDVMFLEELTRRSLKDIFHLKTKEIDSKIDVLENLDSNLFLTQYLVSIEKTNFFAFFSKNTRKEKIEKYIEHLNKNFISLTNFYISELISLAVNNFNFSHAYKDFGNNIFKEIQDESLIPKLFQIIKPYNKYNTYLNLLNFYFEAINDLENTEKYLIYKKKVFEHQSMMSRDDLSYHLNCLKSYCIIKKKISSNREQFAKEYVDLQEVILQKKLFVDTKSEFYIKEQFLNLLTNYDILKDKIKIKQLLNYVKYLHPDFREDMKHLTEAHYHFLNFSYDKVYESLGKINVKDKVFEEKINNLELRVLYEADNLVECLEKIILYKKQRMANKFISKKRTETQLSFLTTLEKLIKVKEKRSNFDAEYLKDKIEKNELISCREWLIEKCYELYDKQKQAYQY